MSNFSRHSNLRHEKYSTEATILQFLEMEEQERNTCPTSIYIPLARLASKDKYIIDLAANHRPGQVGPRLLFSAIHYLILCGAKYSLSNSYYLAYKDALNVSIDDLFLQFREFCMQNDEKIRSIMMTRSVQLNEVRRSGYLVIALLWLSKYFALNNFDFIDVGASAGLNTIWPSYRYLFSNQVSVGYEESPVLIKMDVLGTSNDSIHTDFPKPITCIGIERDPVDLTDHSQCLWLKAQISPSHIARHQLLDSAINLASKDPPKILAGDALEILPDLVISRQNMGHSLVLFFSHSINQMFASGHNGLWHLLSTIQLTVPVFTVVSGMFGNTNPDLYVGILKAGQRSKLHLGECDMYGSWLRLKADFFRQTREGDYHE